MFNLEKELRNRIRQMKEEFINVFGGDPQHFFSSPGQIEIAGHFTSQNYGLALYGATTADLLAAVRFTENDTITIVSNFFEYELTIHLNNDEPIIYDFGHPANIPEKIVEYFNKSGWQLGGLEILIDSNIKPNMDLSLIPAFEALLAGILNTIYNEGLLAQTEILKAIKYTHDYYMGYPDLPIGQFTALLGGIQLIDFHEINAPVNNAISYASLNAEYDLFLIQSGMKTVPIRIYNESLRMDLDMLARYFNQPTIRDVTFEKFSENYTSILEALGERALLRTQIFLEENSLIESMAVQMESGDNHELLNTIEQSANLNLQLIQNGQYDFSPLVLAIAATRQFFHQHDLTGIIRPHKGGLMGTLIAYVPKILSEPYKKFMEDLFGPGSINQIILRRAGVREFYF